MDKEYRIVCLYFKNFCLKCYCGKYESLQSDYWKNFTKKARDFQRGLYSKGFPCFDAGDFINYNGFLFYVEYSHNLKIKDTVDRVSLKPLIYKLYYYSIFNDEEKFFYSGKYAYYGKKLYVDDIASVIEFDRPDGWFNKVKYDFKQNYDVLDYYKIYSKIYDKEEDTLWKILFHVENVKRKLIRLFRKDISVSQEDLLKSVAITSNGGKDAK